jgi:hypothetical protein
MVGCSLQVLRLLPELKLVAMAVEILLKVAMNGLREFFNF